MGGSVLTVGALGATALLAVGLAAVGAAGTESQRVAGIADAAALAAADALAGFASGEPCERAVSVASAQRAGVTSCDVDGLVATVSVAARFAGIRVIAAARAGPPPPDS